MIKVNYDTETTLVKGYYPDAIKYSSIPEPYIEISEEEHQQAIGRKMCVIDDIFQEYVEPYDVLLKQSKAAKKIQINILRDARMAKDIFHKVNGKNYLFQRNITANLAWINYLESESDVAVTSWVTADNSIIDISKNDLVSICAHIRDRDTQAVVQARKSKDLLETLTTIEEVEAFDINQVFEI